MAILQTTSERPSGLSARLHCSLPCALRTLPPLALLLQLLRRQLQQPWRPYLQLWRLLSPLLLPLLRRLRKAVGVREAAGLLPPLLLLPLLQHLPEGVLVVVVVEAVRAMRRLARVVVAAGKCDCE